MLPWSLVLLYCCHIVFLSPSSWFDHMPSDPISPSPPGEVGLFWGARGIHKVGYQHITTTGNNPEIFPWNSYSVGNLCTNPEPGERFSSKLTNRVWGKIFTQVDKIFTQVDRDFHPGWQRATTFGLRSFCCSCPFCGALGLSRLLHSFATRQPLQITSGAIWKMCPKKMVKKCPKKV